MCGGDQFVVRLFLPARMMRASWMSLRMIPSSATVAAFLMGTVLSPPPLGPTTSPRSCAASVFIGEAVFRLRNPTRPKLKN